MSVRGRPTSPTKKGWHHISTAPRDGADIWAIEPTSCGVFCMRFLEPCFWAEDGGDLYPSHPSHWQPYDKGHKPHHPGAEFQNLPHIKYPWRSNIDEPEMEKKE